MGKNIAAVDEQEAQTDVKPTDRTPKISDYLRVFSYATKWDFLVYTIASVASIGAGITLPLMNVVFGQLAGQFTDYYSASNALTRDDFDRILNGQALYIMALFIGRWGLNAINKYCFRMIGIRLSSAIRLHYLQSLFAQSIHVIDSMPVGAPATAITATTNTLQLGISERLGTLLQYITTIVAAIIIAFIWSWDLALVTSSLILYTMLVVTFLMPLILKGQTATLKADEEGTAVASEALGAIRLVLACGGQSHVLARYDEWVQEALKRAQKAAPFLAIQLGLLVCLGGGPPDLIVGMLTPTVVWNIRRLWPSVLVWNQKVHRRRYQQFWCGHRRADVGHDDHNLTGLHINPSHGREQSHGCCLRALDSHRCTATCLWFSQTRYQLARFVF